MKRSLRRVPWYIYLGYIVGIILIVGHIFIDRRWLWSAGIVILLLNNALALSLGWKRRMNRSRP